MLKNIERPVRAFKARWDASDWRPQAALEVPVAPAIAPQVPLAVARQALHRRAPVPEYERRSRAGIFHRWDGRDIITASVALQGAFRDRAQFELHLQGQGGRHQAGWSKLGVRYVLEGSVRKGGKPLAHQRPAHRCHDGVPSVGGSF